MLECVPTKISKQLLTVPDYSFCPNTRDLFRYEYYTVSVFNACQIQSLLRDGDISGVHCFSQIWCCNDVTVRGHVQVLSIER